MHEDKRQLGLMLQSAYEAAKTMIRVAKKCGASDVEVAVMEKHLRDIMGEKPDA